MKSKFLIITVLFFLLIVTNCSPSPVSTTSGPEPIPGVVRLQRKVEFDKVASTVHQAGGKIEIMFTLINRDSESRVISQFPPNVDIQKLNLRSLDKVIRSLPEGTQGPELAPSEEKNYTLVWDQLDDNGKQVAPGWYAIVMEVRSQRLLETTGGGYMSEATRVLILPPEGVMEKSVMVNQSQTVNGLTITLKGVELSAKEVRFFAFTTLTGENPDQPTVEDVPPKGRFWVYATYTVDGITRYAGSAQIMAQGPGNELRLMWTGFLDPVSADASELVFTITEFENVEGPWEFHISLE